MKEVSTERLNRALSLLIKINENLLKIEREEEVFSEVPRIIENIGGYIVCILSRSSKDSLILKYPQDEFEKRFI